MPGEVIKGQAAYWGGHFLHPLNEKVDLGDLTITEDTITFEKRGFWKTDWKIEIPTKKVIWKKVSQIVGEDTAYKQKMSAMAYFAGHGPMTSFSRNTTFIVIPYKDEKGIEHAPKFSMDKQDVLEKVSKFIYEKMSSKK